MTANKLFWDVLRCRCADHRHGVDLYRSPHWPAPKSTMIFDWCNLYEPKDIKGHVISCHGINRIVFDKDITL
jgi:hypothetical protein